MRRTRTWLGYPVSEWAVGGLAGGITAALIIAAIESGWFGWIVTLAVVVWIMVWGVRCLIGLLAALLAR